MSARKLQLSTKKSAPQKVAVCDLANDFFGRLVGLLNRSQLGPTEGLIIEPCKQVHTFFMQFPIDALFVTHDNVVVGVEELAPWRLSKLHFKAKKVIELPRGRCRELGIGVGDVLELESC